MTTRLAAVLRDQLFDVGVDSICTFQPADLPQDPDNCDIIRAKIVGSDTFYDIAVMRSATEFEAVRYGQPRNESLYMGEKVTSAILAIVRDAVARTGDAPKVKGKLVEAVRQMGLTAKFTDGKWRIAYPLSHYRAQGLTLHSAKDRQKRQASYHMTNQAAFDAARAMAALLV